MIMIKEEKASYSPKLLYLDQNQWAQLEKAYYNPQKFQKGKEILDNITNLIEQKKLRTVIDINRKIETSQRKMEKSRKEFSHLLLDLSKGYYVLPGIIFERYEIENYFNRKMGKPEIDIKQIAISKDIQNLLVGKPFINSKELSKKELSEINERVHLYISSDEYVFKIFSEFQEKNIKSRQKYVRDAEDVRKRLYKMKTDKERKDYQINQDFIGLMRKIIETFKLTDDLRDTISDLEKIRNALLVKIHIPQNFDTIKKKKDFMKEFPLYYTLCMLNDFRDRDLRRSIQGNDLIDIISYTLPLVYFNFVIGEKYFINLAKQAKLGDLYGTILLTKIKDFKEYLKKI